MRCLALLATVVILGACVAAPDDCYRYSPRYFSDTAPPLDPAIAAEIGPDVTMTRLFGLLGPAARDIGSGLHMIQWDLTDGRVLTASAPDYCSRPFALHIQEKNHAGL